MAKFLLVLFLALVGAGCGGGGEDSTVQTLDGIDGDVVPDGSWELVRLDFRGRRYIAPELTMESAGQLLSFVGECNTYRQLNPDEIVPALAGIPCDIDQQDIDMALLDALSGGRRLNGEELVLDGSRSRAVYRAVQSTTDTTVE